MAQYHANQRLFIIQYNNVHLFLTLRIILSLNSLRLLRYRDNGYSIIICHIAMSLISLTVFYTIFPLSNSFSFSFIMFPTLSRIILEFLRYRKLYATQKLQMHGFLKLFQLTFSHFSANIPIFYKNIKLHSLSSIILEFLQYRKLCANRGC